MATDVRNVLTKLDENLLAELPAGGKVVSVTPSGLSEFCPTYRIEVATDKGDTQAFFQKESKGEYGLNLFRAFFAAESTMHGFIPDFGPRPLCVGRYKSNPDVHFYLAEFVDLVEDVVPGPEQYMEAVIALHTRSVGKSPDGKFGFSTHTAYGDILQNNEWESSWEAFYTRVMKDAFDIEERNRDTHDEKLTNLKKSFFEKVIPRYLRPLESDGRSVKPTLVHMDLWPGNVRYKLDMETVCIYDSNAFWGHNEADLGVFRNPRYPFGKAYLTEYQKHIPISEPEEDADVRNTIYMLRNQVLLAALFPWDKGLRDIYVRTMELLTDKVTVASNESPSSSAVQAML